jgi:hypothetical protein
MPGAVFTKNAPIIVLVMEFGAGDTATAERVKFSSEQHADRRSGEVNPQ